MLDLNIRPESIKYIEENKVISFHDIISRGMFNDLMLLVMKTNKNIQMVLHKTKKFLKCKIHDN